MSWGDELERIRYFLRDPEGSIWSDAFLRHLYNDVQIDFQHKTKVLEGVVTQRVPGTYHCAYLFDWEWRYLPGDLSQFYQALTLNDEGVCCHRWEPQQVTGIDALIADVGIHFTQPWEAFLGETPGELIRIRFPQNFNAVKFMAYDRWPLEHTSQKSVTQTASYLTYEGTPRYYYQTDETDNAYVLYPRPSVSFDNEDGAGEGVVVFAEGDKEAIDEGVVLAQDPMPGESVAVGSTVTLALSDPGAGIIALRTGSVEAAEIGAPMDLVDVENNVFLVYDVSPTTMATPSDEPDYPMFLRKYIRAGVISRAYAGNNDGRIRSLGEYWGQRYTLGVEYVKRYRRNRRQDRDYRLTASTIRPRTSRHPRLPDTFPAMP